MLENSEPIHQKKLAAEIYRTKKRIKPEIMNEISIFKEPSFHFRNDNMFIRNKIKIVRYGTKAISFLDPIIWNLLPIEYKEMGSLHKFKK